MSINLIVYKFVSKISGKTKFAFVFRPRCAGSNKKNVKETENKCMKPFDVCGPSLGNQSSSLLRTQEQDSHKPLPQPACSSASHVNFDLKTSTPIQQTNLVALDVQTEGKNN